MQFLPVINGYPVYLRPTMFANHVIGSQGDLGHTSPLTTYTDTMSWTHGAHAFKAGIEFRYGYTAGYQPAPVTAPNLGSHPRSRWRSGKCRRHGRRQSSRPADQQHHAGAEPVVVLVRIRVAR